MASEQKEVDAVTNTPTSRPCFDNAIFTNATFGPNTHLTGATFRGAQLNNLFANGIVAQGCDFTGANMDGAKFDGADLRNSRIGGQDIDLSNTSFKGANLEGAIFEPGTKINTATLVEAILDGAVIEGVYLGEQQLSPDIAAAARIQSSDIASGTRLDAVIGVMSELSTHNQQEVAHIIADRLGVDVPDGVSTVAVIAAIRQTEGMAPIAAAMDVETRVSADVEREAGEEFSAGLDLDDDMAQALRQALEGGLADNLLIAMGEVNGPQAQQTQPQRTGVAEIDDNPYAPGKEELNQSDHIELDDGEFELGQCAAPQGPAQEQQQQVASR